MANQPHNIQLNQSVSAPREQVFQAWIKPELMTRWYAPTDEMECTVFEMHPEVGGHYRIQMKDNEGEHVVEGTIQEIHSPDHLKFSWHWEGTPPEEASTVTVDLEAHGDETEVKLYHENFPSEESAEMHNQGWTGCLSRLAKAV